MTNDQFKEAFEEWTQLRDWSLGPVLKPKARHIDRFQELLTKLEAALDPLIKDFSGSELTLPSPWHAAFFLNQVQDSTNLQRCAFPLFRGHADATWTLTPTLDRSGDSPISEVITWVRFFAFEALLQKLQTSLIYFDGQDDELNFAISLSSQDRLAIMQHYGAPTPLLDFTADPNIAVYFASRKSTSSKPDYSCVHVTQIDNDDEKPDAFRIKLVPPFFSRPYLQRGVFLESLTPGDVESSFKPHLTVKFPTHPTNQDFKIIREEEIDILPESKDMKIIQELVDKAWVEFIPQNCGETIDQQMLADFSKEFAASHAHLITPLFEKERMDPMRYFVQFVNEFENLLYWLCHYTFVDGKDALGTNPEALERIIKDNPTIALFISRMYLRAERQPYEHLLNEEGHQNFRGMMIEKIHQALLEIKIDPSNKITFDDFCRLHKNGSSGISVRDFGAE